MKRKIIAVLIALSMLFGVSMNSFADTSSNGEENAKVSKEEAKKTAVQVMKNFFDTEIDEKKYETRVEFRQDYEYESQKEYVWEVSYMLNDNTSHQNINVSINATSGKVVRFNKYSYMFERDQTAKVAEITEEQAKTICDKFIEKINPAELKLSKFVQDPVYHYGITGRPPVYNFRYVRLLNGLKFERNYIMVGIDGTTGKVNSYNYRWDDLKDVPSAIGVIDAAKALEVFKKNIVLQTQYIPVRNKLNYGDIPQNVKIVYAPDFSKGIYVDAREEKMVDYDGKAINNLKIKDLTEKEREDLLKSAVQMEKSSKEMEKSKAEALIKEKISDLFGKDYEIESVSYMENNQLWESRGRNVWNAQFVKKGTDFRYDDRGSVSIDALSGELIYADRYMNDGMAEENFQPKITWDEAYSKGLKLAAKYFPDKIKDIKTEQVYRDQYYYYNDKKILNRTYFFNYPRTVNGILYSDNGIFIEFDAKTGDIRSLRSNWDDKLKFPDTKGIISKEEAEKAFYQNNAPELIYSYTEKAGSTKREMELKLVYILKNNNQYVQGEFIDALTGKAINFLGEEAEQGNTGFKEKIKGHWAEKELKILSDQGIVDAKGLNIDGEIKRLDAVKILVNAKGYNPYNIRGDEALKLKGISKEDPNYKYIVLAVKYGIIDNNESTFDGEQKLTREDVAELIGRLLQYKNLAKSKDIFVLPYKDAKAVSADKLGYVAICKGLGIMEGSEGKFRPKDRMTMAELVVTVYKALGSINQESK